MQPCLISVDWGTSTFRAYLADEHGRVLDRIETSRGILGFAEGDFATYLADVTAVWRCHENQPHIVMSGMIGSRQGWVEAPYVSCPAGMTEISRALIAIETGPLGQVYLVPGVMREGAEGPDVMRGEETQVLGVIALTSPGVPEVIVLPGTHSKWVHIGNGGIREFATFMTGEVFAALKDHTILGRLMSKGSAEGRGFQAGLDAASRAGGPGSLLHRLFSVRTLGLFDRLQAQELAGYLSGLLIGAEILENAGTTRSFTVAGSASLSQRYADAAAHLGLTCRQAPQDCVVAGQLAIARTAGLIGGSP